MADSTTETKRSADVVGDPEEESASSVPDATASTVSQELTLDLKSLKIDESKMSNNFLDEPQDSNISAVPSGDTLYSTATTFEDLKLSPELLRGLYVEMQFTRPSKIQSISLPMILTPPYKDLVAQAHNGSGKTTCFVLGMLSRVDPNMNAPQALCICPTRELAKQNMEVLQKMGKYTGIKSTCAVPTPGTLTARKAAVMEQIIIGTSGTIKKWVTNKILSTTQLKILVFDEADHMLAYDGFRDDSVRIIKDIEENSANCQVLLFSATFNETVKSFVSRVIKDGNQMFVKKEELSLDMVKQYKVDSPDEQAKIEVIKDRIFELGDKLGQTIIFVHSKKSARKLHTSLHDLGWGCTTIHGAVEKAVRDKIVKEFKGGLTKVLISTDLLSRGFDQSQINLVINFDLPVKHDSQLEPDYEVYLHRCGRAGRFGRKGAVFNLLCGDADHALMGKIQNHFGSQIAEVPNWNSDEDFHKALEDAGLL